MKVPVDIFRSSDQYCIASLIISPRLFVGVEEAVWTALCANENCCPI